MNFADLDDDEQHRVVVADSRGELPPGISQQLREPENLRAWKGALVYAVQKANSEFQRKRADFLDGTITSSEHERWKHRNNTFKHEMEKRLSECKDLIHQNSEVAYAQVLKQEREVLLDGVKQHKANFHHDDEPTDGDLKLWSLLDQFP